MAGLCSAHRDHVLGCRLCSVTPDDFFGPIWRQKVAEAEASGKHACEGCGLVFYLTIDMCPLCCRKVAPGVKARP